MQITDTQILRPVGLLGMGTDAGAEGRCPVEEPDWDEIEKNALAII